ncbi:MAG: PTS sugar transporter subunit IIA [Calditrichaeota bacterium]|nr:MAG: PTS sugar transporter subunit IIA [Calditrichota bacterium]
MLADILSSETIVVPLQNTDKNSVIEELVSKLDETKKITNRRDVLQAILDREAVMSTGVGDGVAIPHGKCDAVNELVAALGVTKDPLNFDSIDQQPVRLVWLLVGPSGKTGPHLKALSRISRLMHNSHFRDSVISAPTPQNVLDFIKEEENRYFE